MINTKFIRKATIVSHILIFLFLIFFGKFAESLSYTYDVDNMKNTETVGINVLFAVLLIIHFLLIIINLVDIIQKIINKNVYLKDFLWSFYPLIILLTISGFNFSNLMNFLKSPFNIIMNL